MKKLIISLAVALFTVALPVSIQAADEDPGKKESAARSLPFRGKIESVDKESKSVKVGKNTYYVTTDTRIMKDGKAATLDQANPGEEVGGAFREGIDKKLNLVSLRIGPRPETPAKGEKKEAN